MLSSTADKQKVVPRPAISIFRFMKPVVFLLSLLPLVFAIYAVATNRFVEPVEELLAITGEWGLRFLLITLCITPMQFIFKWGAVAKLRRMLGLFTFFYASMHLLIWVVLDQGLDLQDALAAIVEKKFITLGIVVWIGLLVLAVTSNKWSVRKLGRKWKSVHNSVYILAVLAVVHFIWQVKASELLEPTLYLGALVALLSWRFVRMVKR